MIASVGVPLIWGVALTNLVQGVPLNSQGEFVGSFLDLFSAYTVAGGIATVALFAMHGSIFLELKTVGELRERALHTASRIAPPAAAIVCGVPGLDGDGRDRQQPQECVPARTGRDRGRDCAGGRARRSPCAAARAGPSPRRRSA